jgi:hypothetical protein
VEVLTGSAGGGAVGGGAGAGFISTTAGTILEATKASISLKFNDP